MYSYAGLLKHFCNFRPHIRRKKLTVVVVGVCMLYGCLLCFYQSPASWGPEVHRRILTVKPFPKKIVTELTTTAITKPPKVPHRKWATNSLQLPFGIVSWEELLEAEGLSGTEILQILSDALQNQLESLGSDSTLCSKGTLFCGFDFYCGLTCHLTHRAACLLMAYTMGIPLIHDATTGWVSDSPWEAVYKRLGSGCKPNNNTIYVQWELTNTTLHYDRDCFTQPGGCPLAKQIQYPFKQGIPIPKELFRILKDHHKQPYLWYVGQFLRHTIRNSTAMARIIRETSESNGFWNGTRPVGFHIRRTDKKLEDPDSVHPVEDYMLAAEAYIKAQNSSNFLPYSVYVASDDHNVLEYIRTRYTLPTWRVLGQQCSSTYHNEEERRSDAALKEIVQDIHFLTNCEHVICGFTSGVCRFILALLAAKYSEVDQRLKSLDGEYLFFLQGGTPPNVLLPM